jgi:predicted secreted protein
MIKFPARHSVVMLAVLGLTGAGLAGATTAGATTATASSAAHLRTFRLADSGQHITLAKDHKIKVDLRTDTDGGYSWAIGAQTGGRKLAVVSRTTRPYRHKKGAVGYPYHTIYVLKAIAYGTRTVRFVERQPFDKSNVARRFQLTVRIPTPPKPQHACTTTSSGSCIQGGEFCPQASYGQSGWDAAGRRYVCQGDSTHPHWELP